jgi:TonB family protein
MKQKKDIQNIALSFVCPQNWGDMTICGNGRFCGICQKTVVDFTDKSQAEYDAIVQKHDGQLCGRFTKKQMTPSRLFRDVPSVNFAKAAAFAAFTLVSTSVEAQTVVGKKVAPTTHIPQAVVGYSVAYKNESEYIGGQIAMVEFLKKHIRYKKALQAQGVVHVSFTVETNGQLTNIKVSKGLHPPYDEEAVRLVKLMSGQWKSASVKGAASKNEHTIEIKFPMER